MKKAFITVLTFLLVLTFSTLKAQGEKKIKPFRVALHAAPSISWMKPDVGEYESAGARMGFSYGAIADIHISNNYYFSTGLDITYTGGKVQYPDSIFMEYENGNLEEIDTREFKLQYLHIPMMIKMKTKQIGWWTYFANIGLGTSIRIKADADDVKADGDEKSDIDIKDDVALFRESLIIGGGAQYAVADDISVIATINFNNGFTDIMTDKNSNDNNENSIVNFMEVKLGVLF